MSELNNDFKQRETETLHRHLNSPGMKVYLAHDGVLWVRGLHDGRLHKVPLPVITVTSSDDFQIGRRLGVVEPLLYPSKRLQSDTREQTVNNQ